MGEETAESRHKIYKFDRKHHARKIIRETNLCDVFIRAMHNSDPQISSISLTGRLRNTKPLSFSEKLKVC